MRPCLRSVFLIATAYALSLSSDATAVRSEASYSIDRRSVKPYRELGDFSSSFVGSAPDARGGARTLLHSGHDIRSFLEAHPGSDPWVYLKRPSTRARALNRLWRRLPPTAHGWNPIPSNLSDTARRLSSPEYLTPVLTRNATTGDASTNSEAQHSDGLSLSKEASVATGEHRAAGSAGKPADCKVFIGIFTAPSARGAPPFSKHDYAARRRVLRRTWVAAAARYSHVIVRFVAGRGRGGQPHELEPGSGGLGELQEEAEHHEDVLWLDVEDTYTSLANKTRLFFATVLQRFPDVEYVVKTDDDVYLSPQRLLMAADQWTAAKADVVSCMTHGPVRHDPRHRWFEPTAPLLGPRYPLRPLGSLYVLSARSARMLERFRGSLRLWGSPEDVSITLWLLGTNSRFLEDARLCRRGCGDPAMVALYDPRAMGAPLEAIVAAHMDPGCRAAVQWPLPYAPSLGVGLEPWLEGRREAVMRGMRP